MGGKTSTSTQQVSIPKEVMDRYNTINTRAETVAQTPFQIYSTDPSKFVAQINPQQQRGIGAVNQAAGSYAPYFEKAYGSAAAGMASAQPQALNLDQFYNPFQQQVIDATMRQMTQANEQAQSGALGTAVSSGAFGGDRAGIAAANLANQQGLAMGSTLAGLNAQNYQQALGAAQQQQGVQLGATQADLARLMQGGQFYAGLGQAAQAAGLQGAEAQINAGTLGQQTEQAGLTALYNQFMQQQAYPFQVAQFLANIGMGTGALSGSTTTAVQPGSFFSDRRLKEDVERVGRTDDGLPIYKYRYKGEPETHIGLMADEVEKVKPEAVGLHPTGYKTVDYDRATKADGGGVAGPYGFGVGSQPGATSYVPQAYLPVGELMVADPSMLENARRSFAQQLDAAARFGESVRGLDETWNWAKDKWGGKEREEAVAAGEGASGADVRGYAYGGSAEYLKGGLKPEQPVSKETYLSDILKGQDDDRKRELSSSAGSMPAARTTAQDIADLGKVALAFMGMNTGGRVGYDRGGVPGAASANYPSGVVPQPDRIARPISYEVARPQWKQVGAYDFDPLYGMVRDTASGRMLSDAGRAVRNEFGGIDSPTTGGERSAALARIAQQQEYERGQLASEAADLGSRYENMAAAAAAAGSSQLPQQQFAERYDAYQSALARAEAARRQPLATDEGAFTDIGHQGRILMGQNPIVPAAGTPLPPSPVLAQAAGTPFPSTPSGLGARLMANEPQMDERSDLRFLMSSPDLQGGEYPTGLSTRRPMPRPVSISTSGTPEATGVVAPAGAPAAPAPAPEATGVVTPSTERDAYRTEFTGVAGAGRGYTDVILPDGSIERREGARNWRNNNPGNIEYGPFAEANGAIGSDGRFAVFPTYEAGRAAKEALLFSSEGYAGKTIAEAISRYAPASDNNDTGGYIATVASALGVDPNTPMSELSPAQRSAMLDAMERVEGGGAGGDGSFVRYATGAAPAERRGLIAGLGNNVPYDERNVLGRMMYDPETNELSRNALLALASGVGSMLASPSQFFLPSLGLGMQGFAGTYAGLEKQAADIGFTKAQELQTRMAADAARFIQLQNGQAFVNLGNGRTVRLQEYLRNPQVFTTGDPEMDKRILEAARRANVEGVGTAASAPAPTGVFSTPTVQKYVQREGEIYDLATAREQSAALLSASGAQAAAARSAIPSLLMQADAVAQIASGEGAITSGVLANLQYQTSRFVNDIVGYVNSSSGLNIPMITEGTSPEAAVEILRKAAVEAGMQNATGIQELEAILAAQPGSELDQDANAALMAGMMVASRRSIMRDNFIRQYQVDPNNPNQTLTGADAAFQEAYEPKLLQEKAILKDLLRYGGQVPEAWASQGITKSPMDYLMDPNLSAAEKNRVLMSVLTDEQIAAIADENGQINMAYYFGG